MILTRTPLRITLGGGGTDLDPEFPGGGFCLAAAIDKYVYIAIVDRFDGDLLLTYSESEQVPDALYLKHPLARACLEKVGITTGLHIASMADIPAGTGLGSSAAYTVGLLRALYAWRQEEIEPTRLAVQACEIEKVGRQDQHIAAFGGVRRMIFQPCTRPKVLPQFMPGDTERVLEENLCLFFTGYRHDAGEAIAAEGPVSVETKEIGHASANALMEGDLARFGKLLSLQWRLKLERAPSPVHDEIDGWLRIGREAGAEGGKLVGAGGGGFLLFYAENKATLRDAMSSLGLREVRFRFDYRGSVVL